MPSSPAHPVAIEVSQGAAGYGCAAPPATAATSAPRRATVACPVRCVALTALAGRRVRAVAVTAIATTTAVTAHSARALGWRAAAAWTTPALARRSRRCAKHSNL